MFKVWLIYQLTLKFELNGCPNEIWRIACTPYTPTQLKGPRGSSGLRHRDRRVALAATPTYAENNPSTAAAEQKQHGGDSGDGDESLYCNR